MSNLPESTSGELHDESVVKRKAQVIAVQRLWVALAVLCTMLIMGVILWTSVNGYQARQIILDCTVPEGECFQESQKRTAEVIDAISKQTIEGAVPLHATTRTIVYLAAACADTPGVQTASQIEKCVMDALEERNDR